jgi:hypothetical protein
LLICTCLTFAFADIQYFCIGSWVYTTWSDILFIKLVVLKFLSCTNFFFFFFSTGDWTQGLSGNYSFFGNQMSYCSRASYLLGGPVSLWKWIKGRSPTFFIGVGWGERFKL